MLRALGDFQLVQPIAQHEQIAHFLRQQVATGALPPGTRLPTTKELARTWGVTISCIQAAVTPLVREGLLLRRPRVGTIVRERSATLMRVALYRPSDPAREARDHFARSLAAVVAARLERSGVASELLTDLRPEGEQTAPPSELKAGMRQRGVDAVIACESNERADPWLGQLAVPVAALTPERSANGVWFDHGQFAREGVACLAARGCRSVGLISALNPRRATALGAPHPFRELADGFRRAAAEHGMTLHERWLRQPAEDVAVVEADAERFGYDHARSMCAAADRPDGILVTTDITARGALLGLMALADGSRPPRLVLHRNAETGLFSPLPADFLELSIDRVAAALIASIERQRGGETAPHALLPFSVVRAADG